MTIAAGFRCPEGVVICADTQETVGEFLKRSVPKIIVRANGPLETGDIKEARAVFACAGNGSFIDMLVDKLWAKMSRVEPRKDAVVEALEDELIRVHQRYWPLYPEAERPEVEMLVGLYTPDSCCSLWRADGPIFKEVTTYDCIGYGTSLGKYIGDRLAQ